VRVTYKYSNFFYLKKKPKLERKKINVSLNFNLIIWLNFIILRKRSSLQ